MAAPQRKAPSTLGPYRLIRALGQGGFAPVWLAEETYGGKTLRNVALKLFFLPEEIQPGSTDAEGWLDDVVDEARALCRVEHANVVRFYTLQRDDASGVVGLAMEHVPGTSLDKVLTLMGPLPETKVIEVGISVAWALSAVHEAGLVHRDIKPANVVEGAAGYKLIDFGIVADMPPALSVTGGNEPVPRLVGTPGFVAPEFMQFGGRPSPASDLYALGVTLHMLSTGSLPGKNKIESTGSLWELIALLLTPDPRLRPCHADWVARELMRMHGGAEAPVSGDQDTTRISGMMAPTLGKAGQSMRFKVDPGEETSHDLCADPPMIGRGDTVATIERSAREAEQGHVRVVLLTGPLGIGRTRLLGVGIRIAGFAPERVLELQCSPERRSPLRPLLRALDALPDAGDAAFGLLKDAIDRALAPALIPGEKQDSEALEAVEDALIWAAHEQPVMLALDDLQWGDAHTLTLLQLLVERADLDAASRLFVVATVRDEPNPSNALRALMGKIRGKARQGLKHLALAPLVPEEAAKLAQGIGPLAADVEEAVVRAAGGVPFFVVHALFAWRETGAVVWKNGVFRASGGRVVRQDVPGVADLVEARISSYFEPNSPPFRIAFRALAAVGLYGGGLVFDTLLPIVGGDGAALDEVLEVLVGAGILTVGSERQEYSFAQEMVRQGVLNAVRRRPWFSRLHRALLDRVADGPGATDAAFLATGYEKLGVQQEARIWLGRAIEGAMGAGLFVEAVEFGDRLAALAVNRDTRMDADLEVVRALILGRRFEEAKRRLAQIEERISTMRFSEKKARAQDLTRRICSLEVARGLNEVADDAALLIDADALGDLVLSCKARIALAGVAKGERGLALAGEAIALAERLDPALEFKALVLRVELNHAASSCDLALAEQDLLRALAIAIETSSTWQQIHVEGDLAVIEAELGRVSEAIARLRPLTERAEALGMRDQLRLLLQSLTACLLRQDRFGEAADTAQRTADRAAMAGDSSLQASALSLRADALRRKGDLDLALESAHQAERLQRKGGDWKLALTLLRRAEILEALGRADEAIEDARAARLIAEQRGSHPVLITAMLWETFYFARRGQATMEELNDVLVKAAAPNIANRAFTQSLIAQVGAWLAAASGTRS